MVNGDIIFVCNVQSSTSVEKRRVVVGVGSRKNGGRKVIVEKGDSVGTHDTECNVGLEPCFLTWSCTLPLSPTGIGCISSSSSLIQHRASATKTTLSQTSAASSHGREKEYIEILKRPPGKPNLVICHNLTTSSKTSSFTLNSKSTLGKDNSIDGRAQRSGWKSLVCTFLPIAPSNRLFVLPSTFLPQNKVSSFAALSPQELLRETQYTAVDGRLTSWHGALIKPGKEHRELNIVSIHQECHMALFTS